MRRKGKRQGAEVGRRKTPSTQHRLLCLAPAPLLYSRAEVLPHRVLPHRVLRHAATRHHCHTQPCGSASMLNRLINVEDKLTAYCVTFLEKQVSSAVKPTTPTTPISAAAGGRGCRRLARACAGGGLDSGAAGPALSGAAGSHSITKTTLAEKQKCTLGGGRDQGEAGTAAPGGLRTCEGVVQSCWGQPGLAPPGYRQHPALGRAGRQPEQVGR